MSDPTALSAAQQAEITRQREHIATAIERGREAYRDALEKEPS